MYDLTQVLPGQQEEVLLGVKHFCEKLYTTV